MFNRSPLKISNSCTKNMLQILKHNGKISSAPQPSNNSYMQLENNIWMPIKWKLQRKPKIHETNWRYMGKMKLLTQNKQKYARNTNFLKYIGSFKNINNHIENKIKKQQQTLAYWFISQVKRFWYFWTNLWSNSIFFYQITKWNLFWLATLLEVLHR